MKLGAHLSKKGSLKNLIQEAEFLECESFQFFSDSPRSRQIKKWSKKEINLFLSGVKKLGIKDYFIHASYLLNFFSSNPLILHNSKQMLESYLFKAKQIKAKGVVFHLGSLTGGSAEKQIKQSCLVIEEIAEKAESFLIFENSAGAGNLIGDKIEELVFVYRSLSKTAQTKIRFCLDTAHAFAAGYDLRTKKGLDKFIFLADKLLGLNKVVLWHLNDSASPLGSNRDRHAGIGKGFLGLETFRMLVNHSLFRETPGVIETPKGEDRLLSDRENLNILRSLKLEK